MKFIRCVSISLVVAALGVAGMAGATSFSNDQSDIWWNAAENGWGIQFVQRGNTIFATMFVYDANGKPTWYVAALQGSKPGGVLTFTGDLYTATGPWFGTVPYDPSTTGSAKVGTMKWTKTAGNPGTLTYSVNGVDVTKSLTRQPIGTDDYSGTYNGALHFATASCNNPADNGPTDDHTAITITQNGAAFTLALTDFSCTLTGTYEQNGQFGSASGNYTCPDGDAGTFQLANMIVAPYGMLAVLSASSNTTGCQTTGQIGAARRPN